MIDKFDFRSSGCRVLTRHMSISDVVGKRREIVVPARAKPKEKDKKKKEKSRGNNIARGLKTMLNCRSVS